MGALDPALGFLSALTSIPAAFYYARLFGAASVRVVRNHEGRSIGLRIDRAWTLVLIAFSAATALIAGVTALVQAAVGPIVSTHAALGTMLVIVLWRPAREPLVRAFLVFLLAGAGAARILNEGESVGSVLAGFAAGAGIACLVHATMRQRLRRRTR